MRGKMLNIHFQDDVGKKKGEEKGEDGITG